MNRHTIVAMFLVAIVPLVGARAADKIRVVATTPDLGAIAREVGGDLVEVASLSRPAEDPHFVDARPSFIPLLNRADLLIEGGAQLEAGWLPPLLDAARNGKIALGKPGRVVAAEGISLRDAPVRLDRSLGDVHPSGNPHYMLDPRNGTIVAKTISEAFCRVDREHCSAYEANRGRFTGTLDAKIREWSELLEKARGARFVAYHRNFDYFAERFGLELVDTLEPKPGIPPSPAHIEDLVREMKSHGARLILCEPSREQQNPRFVAEATGAKLVLLPIMPGVREAPGYIELFDLLVHRVEEAT